MASLFHLVYSPQWSFISRIDKVSFSFMTEEYFTAFIVHIFITHSFIKEHSHASKVMLKILQARLQQYVNRELPDVQAGFGKGRGTREQIANICWIMEKTREFQKNIYFCFMTMPKPLTVWITINCGKF